MGLTWRMVPPRYFHGPLGEMPSLSHGVARAAAALALHRAGVAEVAGRSPLSWHRSCLDAVRASVMPARLYPGFRDNDGRCCGTAGVGDVFLDN